MALHRRSLLLIFLLLVLTPGLNAQGVEARSLAASGGVLYVGTSAGAIYTSTDGGETWRGFAKFRQDYVIDCIAVDGPNIYVASWTMGDPSQGAFLHSTDSGKTWVLTSNKHFTALTVVRGVVYVGSADGVYRSVDGLTFEAISTGIKNVQSIAVDPESPSSIFVGTWHLGYFTHNGGMTWHSIHKGIINDSDFFTIVLNGNTIYIGACSGIYKGSDDGEQFRKEKTKTDARRTKVLRQVSNNTLYAGTTDGIWISTDAGKTWKRRGSRYITVNDMLATSSNHLVVATLHHGVIWSDDGGKTYTQAQF